MNGGWVAAGVVLFVYFFFPVALVLPLKLAEQSGVLSRASVDRIAVIFIPVGYLYDHVPAYNGFIKVQERFMEQLLPNLP